MGLVVLEKIFHQFNWLFGGGVIERLRDRGREGEERKRIPYHINTLQLHCVIVNEFSEDICDKTYMDAGEEQHSQRG